MQERQKVERYRFWIWLIKKAILHRHIYWLLWGILIVLGLYALQFNLGTIL